MPPVPPVTHEARAERAPKFRLESDGGEELSLDDFAGKWLVLYFYPRDNTPGCTLEAQDFSRSMEKLERLGAAVVGVSKDSTESHCRFRDKIGIRFPLLSDPDLDVHRAYQTWGTKMMYGKKILGTIRSTFLISPEGRIVKAWRGVRVNGHAASVVEALSAERRVRAAVGERRSPTPPAKKGKRGKKTARS
jgi:peroxiredoxin Q/BCP